MNTSIVGTKAKINPEDANKASAGILPKVRSVPVGSIEGITAILYGERKIGKTSLISEFPEALFLMCEPGGKGLAIYQTPINTWTDFVKCVVALKREKHSFRTVCVDTVDILYDLCLRYVMAGLGKDHPSDLGYGKGWKAVSEEFTKGCKLLLDCGIGTWFISHADDRTFELRTGGSYSKIVPTMPKQAGTYIRGVADAIFYYGFFGSERWLVVEGSEEVEGGIRLPNSFKTTSGEKVLAVPMGKSSKEGYNNLMKAFNNQQEFTGDREGTTLSQVPAKMSRK